MFGDVRLKLSSYESDRESSLSFGSRPMERLRLKMTEGGMTSVGAQSPTPFVPEDFFVITRKGVRDHLDLVRSDCQREHCALLRLHKGQTRLWCAEVITKFSSSDCSFGDMKEVSRRASISVRLVIFGRSY